MESSLVRDNLLGLEPQADLLLGVLDGVRAVADVAADVLVGRLVNNGNEMLKT